jgi:hypothetical protein
MTRTVTEEDPRLAGLAMLLMDVLAGEDSELELLARYARAPEQLAADQRAELEYRIAQSPALADQLRVLRRFAAGGSSADAPRVRDV